jgi:hypothetical protein
VATAIKNRSTEIANHLNQQKFESKNQKTKATKLRKNIKA